jgi:pimeloyl-ACP methyl ester carboxylesterase
MTSLPPRLHEPGYANSRFVDLVGVRTHVQAWEPADAAPTATVVALHHFYGSAQTFHRLGPLVAQRGLRLVAFDRVGFGLTDRPDPGPRLTGPDSPYTRAFAVRQVAALLDDLGVDRAVVTGTSMGGTVALEFALAHPERTAHVVPCSAPLTGDASAPPWLRPVLRGPGLARVGARIVRRLGREVGHARVARSFHDPSVVVEADVDAHARFLDATGWDRGLWFKWVADDPPSLLARLPDLARDGTAVTAVGATHDRLVRPGIARRTAELAGGRFVELPCGHLVHVEGAVGLADILADAAGVA